MSKERNMLNEIKKLVFGEEVQATEVEETAEAVETPEVAEPVTEEKFEAVSLSDGTLLNIEPSIQVGASVMVEDPAQGMVIVPDGSYELEDGRIMNVVGGAIESIEEVAEAEESAEEPQAEEMESEKDAPAMNEREVRKIIESVETHFNSVIDSFKSEIATLKEELAKEKENSKEINEKFYNALEELAKTPSEEPKKKSKDGFNFNKPKNNIFFK